MVLLPKFIVLSGRPVSSLSGIARRKKSDLSALVSSEMEGAREPSPVSSRPATPPKSIMTIALQTSWRTQRFNSQFINPMYLLRAIRQTLHAIDSSVPGSQFSEKPLPQANADKR